MRTSTKDPSFGQSRHAFIPNGLCRGLLVALLAIGAAACATVGTTGNEPKTLDTESVRILTEVLEMAQSECSIRTPPDPRDAAVSPPQIFVEATLIEVPAGGHWRLELGSLSEVANLPSAKLVATPHIIARLDTETTMDLGTRLMPPGATLQAGMYFKRMTILPRFSSPGVLAIDLDLALETSEPGQAASQTAPVEAHLRNTFVVRERQAAKLHTLAPGYSRGSLLFLIKPHIVNTQADLRDIFVCKMQQRQRSLARRRPG